MRKTLCFLLLSSPAAAQEPRVDLSTVRPPTCTNVFKPSDHYKVESKPGETYGDILTLFANEGAPPHIITQQRKKWEKQLTTEIPKPKTFSLFYQYTCDNKIVSYSLTSSG